MLAWVCAGPLCVADAQPSTPTATPPPTLASLPGPDAAAPVPDLTDPQRWNETAYGISLRPPEGWTSIPAPRDGDDFAWHKEGMGQVAFKIAYSTLPVQLDEVSLQALVQMGFALDSPRLRRGAEQRRIGNRPGTVMLFDIDPEDGSEPWFYAHAVVMLEPYAAAVVKVQCNQAQADAALAHFEAMLDSLHVPLGDELEAMRRPQIDQGQAWLNTLPPHALVSAIPEQRWYRLSINGQHVGHRLVQRISDPVTLARDPELRRRGFVPPGTAVVVQNRREHDGVALDRLVYLYTEAAGEIEIWELKQTLRPVAKPADAPGLPGRADKASDAAAITWVETGIRGPQARPGTTAQNVIQVVQEVPPTQRTVAGVKAYESFLGSAGVAAARDNQGQVSDSVSGRTHSRRWRTPEVGYLGQIEVMGLPAAMPNTPGTAFAFYAWDPGSEALALRTVRVGPDPQGEPGGYIVYERPSSSISESRHRFSAQGVHLDTLIPGGLTITPTTAEEFRAMNTAP